MKYILSKAAIYKYFLILAFVVAASSAGIRLKYPFMIAGFICYSLRYTKKKNNIHDSAFRKMAFTLTVLFFLLLFFQVVFKTYGSLGSSGLKYSVNYIMILIFAPLACFIIAPTLTDPFGWSDAISDFLILYCLYCIIFESTHGMSNVRSSSSLGYASKNYMAAITYMFMPYMLFSLNNSTRKRQRNRCYFAIILSIILIIISGSRTSYGVLLSVIALMISQQNLSGKRKIMLYFNLALAVIMLICLYFQISSIRGGIDRVLSILSRENDGDRGRLRQLALLYYRALSPGQKLFGTGRPEFPMRWGIWRLPHNFIFEMLLGIGAVGTIVYTGTLTMFSICSYLKTEKTNRVYILQSVFVFVLTAFFQPFFSTSILCGFAYLFSIMAISGYSNESYFGKVSCL